MKKVFIAIALLFLCSGVSAEPFEIARKATVQLSSEEQAELFRVYCAIGDSLSQGAQSLNVEEHRQYYSVPAQLARQMDTPFVQPLMRYPGCGTPNLEDWIKDDNIGPGDMLRTMTGNHRTDRHYENQDVLNNFAVTGITIGQIIDWPTTIFSTDSSAMLELLGHFNPWLDNTLGGFFRKRREPALDQALARNPTFLTLWIGNNDNVVSAVAGTSKFMTPVDVFEDCWNEIVERIKATPSVKGVVVCTLPDVTTTAFFQPVGNSFNTPKGDIPSGSLVPFFASVSSGDDDVLTPAEINKIREHVNGYNAIIRKTAAAEDWALVDVHSIFNNVVVQGMPLHNADGSLSGVTLSTEYATGGVFSLDGLHPSTTSYTYMANVCIRVVNAHYGSNLPLIDEMEVWKNDSLCQNPVDPRTEMDMKYITKLFNMMSVICRDRNLPDEDEMLQAAVLEAQ